MKQIFAIFFLILVSSLVSAQDHGHSHGSGGETEHLYPVLAVFGLLIIGGAIFHFMTKKK